jgi:hypothetical protein
MRKQRMVAEMQLKHATSWSPAWRCPVSAAARPPARRVARSPGLPVLTRPPPFPLPSRPDPAAIFVRKQALVLNLEGLKLIISRDRTLVISVPRAGLARGGAPGRHDCHALRPGSRWARQRAAAQPVPPRCSTPRRLVLLPRRALDLYGVCVCVAWRRRRRGRRGAAAGRGPPLRASGPGGGPPAGGGRPGGGHAPRAGAHPPQRGARRPGGHLRNPEPARQDNFAGDKDQGAGGEVQRTNCDRV